MNITDIVGFRDQQHFSSTSLGQEGSTGRDWRKKAVENYNEAANLLLIMEERLEQQEKYIARLEKMNDALLTQTGSANTTNQELA